MLAVFGWEVLCALVVLYSVAQLVRGKRINQLLTDHYRPVIEKALTEMFTICRHHSETTGQVISYATGREHLASLSVRLSLRPRYDFVRSVWDWVSKYRSPGAANVGDQLDYEVIPDDKYQRNSAGFIFAICRQSAIAQLKTERYDLATFARVFNKNNQSDWLPEGICLFVDDAGSVLVDRLLQQDPIMRHCVTSLSSSLHSFIISSVPLVKPTTLEEFTKQEMRINMRLLVSDKQQQLTQQAVQATRAVIYMAERICLEFNNDQLPAECRLKFTKQHRIAKESLEKQLRRQLLEEQEREGEQRRKQKQQERQAEIDKLPREARRKLEEKESKREAKKLMQRRAKQIK